MLKHPEIFPSSWEYGIVYKLLYLSQFLKQIQVTVSCLGGSLKRFDGSQVRP